MMKRKLYTSTLGITLGLLLCALGSGCAWSIGGKKTGETAVQPTLGQQLMDLKTAQEQGALTTEEYERQKQALLQP